MSKVTITPPPLIPNRNLSVADLPKLDVPSLDPQNFNGGHREGGSERQ